MDVKRVVESFVAQRRDLKRLAYQHRVIQNDHRCAAYIHAENLPVFLREIRQNQVQFVAFVQMSVRQLREIPEQRPAKRTRRKVACSTTVPDCENYQYHKYQQRFEVHP